MGSFGSKTHLISGPISFVIPQEKEVMVLKLQYVLFNWLYCISLEDPQNAFHVYFSHGILIYSIFAWRCSSNSRAWLMWLEMAVTRLFKFNVGLRNNISVKYLLFSATEQKSLYFFLNMKLLTKVMNLKVVARRLRLIIELQS